MAKLKDDIRDIIGDLSRLLAEDETQSGTAASAEHLALTRIFFGVDALLRGELLTCQAWLDEADGWIVETFRRRGNEDGMVPAGKWRH